MVGLPPPQLLPSFPISCSLARPPACLLSTFPLSRVAARIIIIIISIYRPSPFYSSSRSSLVIEAAREGERKAIESTRDAPRHASSTSSCAHHYSPGNEPSIEMNGRATQPDKKRCQELMPGHGQDLRCGCLMRLSSFMLGHGRDRRCGCLMSLCPTMPRIDLGQ